MAFAVIIVTIMTTRSIVDEHLYQRLQGIFKRHAATFHVGGAHDFIELVRCTNIFLIIYTMYLDSRCRGLAKKWLLRLYTYSFILTMISAIHLQMIAGLMTQDNVVLIP